MVAVVLREHAHRSYPPCHRRRRRSDRPCAGLRCVDARRHRREARASSTSASRAQSWWRSGDRSRDARHGGGVSRTRHVEVLRHRRHRGHRAAVLWGAAQSPLLRPSDLESWIDASAPKRNRVIYSKIESLRKSSRFSPRLRLIRSRAACHPIEVCVPTFASKSTYEFLSPTLVTPTSDFEVQGVVTCERVEQ